MKTIVLKFGGTSVASPEQREKVICRVREAIADGYRPVVVVSAMGRYGEPYATDTLKKLAEDVYPDIPLRELDLLMSCGEIISAAVLSATLHKNDIPARVFTGAQAGLVTDGVYGNAQVMECNTDKLKKVLEKEEVPVVAGFQGATPDHEINTMGRGGSDTTAVILGAALDSDQVDIFTDVKGIATADPRVCSDARVIKQITYSEVTNFAYEGAKVIHPTAVEVAMKNNVKVVVRSLTDDSPGTVITAESVISQKDYRVNPRQVVSGVAHISDLVQFMVEMAEPDSQLELKIFETLGEAGVSIDLIGVFPNIKVFCVKKDMEARTKRVMDKLQLPYRIKENCAKVSVVGAGMRNIPGVMARIVRSLQNEKIQILQTGDSNISICLLVNEEDLPGAVKTLHEHFELDKQGELAEEA